MFKSLGELYAAMLPLGLLLAPVAIFMLFIGYPILAFRAVRNLRTVSRQLERLNEILDSKLVSN